MPVVVGGGILPREIVRPKWYADMGYAQGRTIGKIEDAILAALLGGGGIGQVPTQPTPQRPGQLQFPSGAMTNTSPDELAQIQAMGGVPNRQGGMVPFGTGAPNAVSYQPPTRLGIKPNLDFQAKQLQLQKAQQELDPNSPMNQYLAAEVKRLTGATPNQSGADASGNAFYQPGDVLERAGKRWKIVGLDTDGMPLVEEE